LEAKILGTFLETWNTYTDWRKHIYWKKEGQKERGICVNN